MAARFWDDLSDSDREIAYSPRHGVPDAERIIEGWLSRSAAIAAESPPETVAYGDGGRHRLHLFPLADPAAPTCFFIHGGYWQSREPKDFYFLARDLNAAGFSVILPGYDLCPDVRLAEICVQLERAYDAAHARVGRPMLVGGHSAGGHLCGWLMTRPGNRDRIAAGLPVSGVFEPEPLIGTWINDKVGMDAAEAERCSAMRAPVAALCPTRTLVGGAESRQFHLQAELWTDKLKAAGADADWISVTGCNHFDILDHVPDHARGVWGRVDGRA
ncbi:MAG: alpha/beta hydrolase [Alphaproteobacteria bacterium]